MAESRSSRRTRPGAARFCWASPPPNRGPKPWSSGIGWMPERLTATALLMARRHPGHIRHGRTCRGRRLRRLLSRPLRTAHHSPHAALHRRHVPTAWAAGGRALTLCRLARLCHWIGRGALAHAAHHSPAARGCACACGRASGGPAAHLSRCGCARSEGENGRGKCKGTAHDHSSA